MTRSKADLLAADEVDTYRLRDRVEIALRAVQHQFGVERDGLRILDWGCGRGLMVCKLLDMGFDAYGVDIDPKPIANGSPLLASRRHDPERRLICIGQDCRTPFAEGFFHVVLSDQVFEHVQNLTAIANEMRRVTAWQGTGLHIFPPKWTLIEPHLRLPLIHWLPKNRLRYLYLRAVAARMDAFQELASASPAERAAVYFNYSVEKTYYRSPRSIKRVFEKNGFSVSFEADCAPSWRLKLLLPFLMLDTRVVRTFWQHWANRFREVILVAKCSDRRPPPAPEFMGGVPRSDR
jgi:SAM-dependent methyltransferase